MTIENTTKITKDAFLWLALSGLFAVALASMLFYTDEKMATSNAEHEHNVTMQRVRTAQAELGSGNVDPRQIGATVVARRLSELQEEKE